LIQSAALLHIGLDDDLQSELAGDIRHEIIEDGVLISTCGGLEVHLSVADLNEDLVLEGRTRKNLSRNGPSSAAPRKSRYRLLGTPTSVGTRGRRTSVRRGPKLEWLRELRGVA
jgi:hypothetical protein